jgi:hypothetical protein
MNTVPYHSNGYLFHWIHACKPGHEPLCTFSYITYKRCKYVRILSDQIQTKKLVITSIKLKELNRLLQNLKWMGKLRNYISVNKKNEEHK